MKAKIYAITNHKLFAWVLYVAVAIFFCWENKYFPSLDGPTHYHNALLIKEYLLGNETVHSHFVLTPFYIPNIFSHYVLAILFAAFSFKISVLLFFFSYYVLYLHAANYLLKSYKVKHSLLFTLVFSVFFYSHLLSLGFHNFMWSFVFLFYAIGFYNFKLKHEVETKNKSYVLFFFVSTLLYYTNALAFLFLLLFLFLDFLISIKNISWKRIFKLTLSLLFPLILLLLFQFKKNPPSMGDTSSSNYTELTNGLFKINCLINYASEGEKPYNTVMLYAIITLILSAFYVKIIRNEKTFISSDVFFVTSIFVLMLYYFIPDSASVGMMSMRLLHFFYVFLLLWLVLQSNTFIKYLAVLVLFFTGLKKYSDTAPGSIAFLNQSAGEIIKGASVIKPNSDVIVFNRSKDWLHLHYAEYIGVEKPLLLLYNPEAVLGWFPLIWNESERPNYIFNNQSEISGSLWKTNGSSVSAKKPDYVFLFGEIEDFKNTSDYTDEVTLNYSLVYKSQPEFVEVYALNKTN